MQIIMQTLWIARHFSLVLIAGMMVSCEYSKESSYINVTASVSIPGIPFNIEQGFFLNQYADPSSRTTSWILADSGFINGQSVSDFTTATGRGKLCVVHWSQTPDPVWIGARIPGRFLWADVLMYEGDTLIIKHYLPNGTTELPNELYRKKIKSLLQEISMVRFPADESQNTLQIIKHH